MGGFSSGLFGIPSIPGLDQITKIGNTVGSIGTAIGGIFGNKANTGQAPANTTGATTGGARPKTAAELAQMLTLMGLAGAAGYFPTPSSSTTNTTGTNTTKGTTSSTGVQTPNLSPGQQGLIDLITKQYGQITSGIPAAMEGIKNTGLQTLNRSAQLAGVGQQEAMAARGLASSPASGVAAGNLDNERFASTNRFLQSLPMMQQQMTLNALQPAGNFALSIPHGQTTTQTGTTDQTTNVDQTSKMEGSQGGGIQGLLAGLAGVLGQDLYGRDRQPVININGAQQGGGTAPAGVSLPSVWGVKIPDINTGEPAQLPPEGTATSTIDYPNIGMPPITGGVGGDISPDSGTPPWIPPNINIDWMGLPGMQGPPTFPGDNTNQGGYAANGEYTPPWSSVDPWDTGLQDMFDRFGSTIASTGSSIWDRLKNLGGYFGGAQ